MAALCASLFLASAILGGCQRTDTEQAAGEYAARTAEQNTQTGQSEQTASEVSGASETSAQQMAGSFGHCDHAGDLGAGGGL